MNGNLIKILISAMIGLLTFMGVNIRMNTSGIHAVGTKIARVEVRQESIEKSVDRIDKNVEKIADRI